MPEVNTLLSAPAKVKMSRKGVDILREAVKRQNGQAYQTNELFLGIVEQFEARISAIESQVLRRVVKIDR